MNPIELLHKRLREMSPERIYELIDPNVGPENFWGLRIRVEPKLCMRVSWDAKRDIVSLFGDRDADKFFTLMYEGEHDYPDSESDNILFAVQSWFEMNGSWRKPSDATPEEIARVVSSPTPNEKQVLYESWNHGFDRPGRSEPVESFLYQIKRLAVLRKPGPAN